MKRKTRMIALCLMTLASTLITSCATVKSPVGARLYVNVTAPMAVTGNANSTKVGTAQCTSILGIIATGDASINAACKSAGITKIHHVDEESTLVLGLFAKYKIYVYGE